MAIAALADIVRHVSILIVPAERNVLLITFSWSPFATLRLLSEALGKISVRAGGTVTRTCGEVYLCFVVRAIFVKAKPSLSVNTMYLWIALFLISHHVEKSDPRKIRYWR